MRQFRVRHALEVGERVGGYVVEDVVARDSVSIRYHAREAEGKRRKVTLVEYQPPIGPPVVGGTGETYPRGHPDDQSGGRSDGQSNGQSNGMARFESRARALAAVPHPGLIPVLEVLVHKGTGCMAVADVGGRTLADLLVRARRWDEPALRHLLDPLLDALAALHSAGIVHGEITPNNIVISHEGGAALFPAPSTHAAEVATDPGIEAQLPSVFRAPELRGDPPPEPGPRADVYALAAILAAITRKGQDPRGPSTVDGAGPESDPDMAEFVRPAALTPFSDGFRRAVEAGLAADPADRPPDAVRWRAMFDATPVSGDAPASRPSHTGRHPSSRRRWTVPAGIAAAMLTLVIGGALIVERAPWRDRDGAGPPALAGTGAAPERPALVAGADARPASRSDSVRGTGEVGDPATGRLAALESELARTRAARDAAVAESARLDAELAAALASTVALERAATRREAALTVRAAALEARDAGGSAALTALETEREALVGQVAGLESDLASVRSEGDALAADAQRRVAAMQTSLTTERRAASAREAALAARVATFETGIAEREARLESASRGREGLVGRVAALESELAGARAAFQTTTAETERTVGGMRASIDLERQAASAREAALVDQVTTLEAGIVERDARLADGAKQREELAARVAAVESQLAGARAARDAGAVASQREVAGLRDALEAARRAATARESALVDQVSTLEAGIAERDARLADATKQREELAEAGEARGDAALAESAGRRAAAGTAVAPAVDVAAATRAGSAAPAGTGVSAAGLAASGAASAAKSPSSATPGSVFADPLPEGRPGPEMVWLPPGSFAMGSPAGEPGRDGDEGPRHTVVFERPFALARRETSVAEFRAFVEDTSYRTDAERSGWSHVWRGRWVREPGVSWRQDGEAEPAGDDYPVVHVSWVDAVAYARWLATATGAAYRLPTEAELEYAIRAGSSGAYPWGDGSPVGNFAGSETTQSGAAFPGYADGQRGLAPVGSYPANAFGLDDTVGNVWEFAADCYRRSYAVEGEAPTPVAAGPCGRRVARGGSWINDAPTVRSANRYAIAPGVSFGNLGIRVAREP